MAFMGPSDWDTPPIVTIEELEAIAGSLLQRGQFQEAELAYRQLIERGSNNHVVYCNLGSILRMQGRTLDAVPWFERALQLDPDSLGAHVALGLTFQECGDFATAIASYTRALQLDAQLDDVRFNLGVAHRQVGQMAEALACFTHLLTRYPTDPRLHLQLGSVHLQMASADAAIAAFQMALRLDPNDAVVMHHLAQAWQQLGELTRAVDCYRQALVVQPDDPFIHNNLGTALQRQGVLDGAVAAYQRAIAIDSQYQAAHSNLGVAWHQLGDFPAALTSFKRALQLAPRDPEARLNYATTLLLTGDYSAGWQHFEARFERAQSQPHATPSLRRWDGSPLPPGSSVVLVSEQGLGDTLQFMRYALPLQQCGVRVTLCVQPPLQPLVAASRLCDAVLSSNEPAADHGTGCWLPLLSLPSLLGVSAARPLVVNPYINTTQAHLAQWATQLGGETRPIIGLHWQGNPRAEQSVLRGRSFPLDLFAPLAAMEDIVLLSLQKGEGSEQLQGCSFRDRFVRIQTSIDAAWDFLDTAAIISQCDLVITNDSAVAHLAGGMGQRTWLLLHSVPDWRWGVSGDTCTWYPSLRLFRQRQRGEWAGVMQEVVQTLRRLLACGDLSVSR